MNHEAECWHGTAEHTAHGTGVKMTPMTSSVQELSTNLNKVPLTRTSLPTSAFTIKNTLNLQGVPYHWAHFLFAIFSASGAHTEDTLTKF